LADVGLLDRDYNLDGRRLEDLSEF